MVLKNLVPATAIAASAFGQTAAQAPAQAPAALLERVQQFYQLQSEGRFREAEALVAADTKDFFYASSKTAPPSFTVQKVVMKDNGTRAEVTVVAKMNVMVMGKGMVPMDLPTTGNWKLENGLWCFYVDQSGARKTPFGEMKLGTPAADAAGTGTPDIREQVNKFDVSKIFSSVTLANGVINLTPESTFAEDEITNNMTGSVDLILLAEPIGSVSVALDKTHLEAGQKAKLTFKRLSPGDVQGASVRVRVSPLQTELTVQVNSR